MNIWWIMRTEIRRLIRSRIGRAAIVVGLIIPLLYSSLYLYAFWDPYEQLDEFPIALVNLDQGGENEGKREAYGEQIVKELVEDAQFKWNVVSPEEADRGLEAGDYYLKVTVPATFTQDVLSVNGDNPHRAKLEFVANQGKNYIASTIVQRLESSLREEVGNTFTKEYVSAMFDVIGEAGNGLTEAADGAGKLADGSQDVATGSSDLKAGADKLQDGARKLATGTSELATGAGKVAEGSARAANGAKELDVKLGTAATGASQLNEGANQLAAGADSVSDAIDRTTAGVKQVRDQLSGAATGSDKLAGSLGRIQGLLGGANGTQPSALELLRSLQQRYPGLAADGAYLGALQMIEAASGGLGQAIPQVQGSKAGLNSAVSALDTIAAGQDKAAAGAKQVAAGTAQLAGKTTELAAGLDQLKAQGTSPLAGKLGDLANGSQSLANGTQTLLTGARDLAKGTNDLSSGAGKLAAGSRQVADGNRELADELTGATSQIKQNNAEQKAEMMANPVEVASEPLHPVSTYGMGFASYFIPLSLWVGALVLYFILSMKEYRWLIAPVSSTSIVLGKFFTLALIGVGQAVISGVVLTQVLGLQVLNMPEFFLFSILISMTSIAIIGFLIARLGSGPGRFFAILLLILQLTSSAGTFPIEMVPGFFREIHPYLPMSYGIEGLRSIIAIGDESRIWHDIGVIAAILVGVLTLQIVTTRRTLRVKDLHEKDTLKG